MCERALTAVVEDELLQAGELSAGGDVEAAAVQLPDLVMFHVQAFGVVVVQHRQAVGPCKDDTQVRTLRGSRGSACVRQLLAGVFLTAVQGPGPPGPPLPPQPTQRLLEMRLILSSSNLGGTGTEFSLRNPAGSDRPLVSFNQKQEANQSSSFMEPVKRLAGLGGPPPSAGE